MVVRWWEALTATAVLASLHHATAFLPVLPPSSSCTCPTQPASGLRLLREDTRPGGVRAPPPPSRRYPVVCGAKSVIPVQDEAQAVQGGQEGNDPPSPADPKAELFRDLKAAAKRKLAFENLWNSDFTFTEEEYHELLRSCCRLGYVRPYLDLVDEVTSRGMNMTEEQWGACISIACSREYFRLALAAMEKMLNMGTVPSSRTVAAVLGLCQKQNRYRDAVKIYDIMKAKNIQPEGPVYWTLGAMLAQGDQWEEFMMIEKELRETPDLNELVIERFYSSALSAGKTGAGGCENAVRMLRKMRDVGAVPTVRTVSAVLSMCLSAGDLSALQSLVSEAEGWKEVVFDVPIYNIIISSFVGQKDLASAERWLARLRAEGLSPTTPTYSAYMKVAAAAGQPGKAREAFDRLVEEGLEVNTGVANTLIQLLAADDALYPQAEELVMTLAERYGVKPNAQSFSHVLRKLTELSEGDRAFEVYQRMKSMGVAPDAWTVRETVWACSKGRCMDAAKLKELSEDLLALKGDGEGRSKGLVLAHGGVIRACDRLQDTDRALEVWQSVVDRGLRLDDTTLTSLVQLLSRNRRAMEMISIYDQLCATPQGATLGETVMGPILGALASIDPLRCVQVFQELKASGRADQRAYTHALTALDNLGDVDGLERLAKEMADGGISFERTSYGALLRGLANGGKVEEAFAALRKAEEVGVGLNNYTVAMTVIGLKKLRRYQPALEVMRELKAKGMPLNLVAYNSILTVCSASQAPDGCLEVLEEMEVNGVEPDYTTLQLAMTCLVATRREDDGMDLIRKYGPRILFPKMDYFMFKLLSNAAAVADPPYVLEIARHFVDRAQARNFKQVIDYFGYRRSSPDIAEQLMRLYPRKDLTLYNAVVSTCLRSGNHQRALELIREAEKEGFTLDQVACSLGLQASYLAGDIAHGEYYLDLLQGVEKFGHSNSTANFGVCLLAKAGRWDRLESVLTSILEQQKRGRVFGVNELTVTTVGEVVGGTEGLEEGRSARVMELVQVIRSRSLADLGSKGGEGSSTAADAAPPPGGGGGER